MRKLKYHLPINRSGLTEEMYKEGYTNSTNIDISPTVVKQMQERCKEECPNAKCKDRT